MNQTSVTVSSLNFNLSVLSQSSCDEYFCLNDFCEEEICDLDLTHCWVFCISGVVGSWISNSLCSVCSVVNL